MLAQIDIKPVWNDRIWSDHIWSDCIWSDHIWSDCIWSDRIWSDHIWSDVEVSVWGMNVSSSPCRPLEEVGRLMVPWG